MLKFIRSVFFGNYFIGLIAIALSVESCVQLQLPLNSNLYYFILFCATVSYYTYAYLGPLSSGVSFNPRKNWYNRNHNLIVWSQRCLFMLGMAAGIYFIVQHAAAIVHLPFIYWLIILVILLAGIFYYGLLPASFLRVNLRRTGLLKAFVIGFVWACCANLLSYIMVQVESGAHTAEAVLLTWLFIKNWMFCTVNAIIFDIKDYSDDSNKQLKTFVVRFGIKQTIFFVLLPLTVIGLLSLIAFTASRHMGSITLLFNLLPFVLLFLITWSMQKPHKILYYLVVIDGLIFLKALCGIAGTQFINY